MKFTLHEGSSHCWLTNEYYQACHPLRSTSITEASSLLRDDPPLCSASGLPSLWGFHLGASLSIGTTGSHVPHKSLDHVHATFMLAAAQAVSRCPLGLSGSRIRTPFLTTSGELSTPQQWFGVTRLHEPYLTRSYAGPFPQRSPPWLFTTAA